MPAAPQRSVLIAAGSTTGMSQAIDTTQLERLCFYFTSVGDTSTGNLLIEEADWDRDTEPEYTGTWSQVATIATNSFTGGAQIAYHISPNAYAFLRVRINTTVSSGGTIKAVARFA
jgi:hypothetical protein